MIVYVVTEECYDEVIVVGVYSTRGKAENRIKHLNADDVLERKGWIQRRIEEFEVDPGGKDE